MNTYYLNVYIWCPVVLVLVLALRRDQVTVGLKK